MGGTVAARTSAAGAQTGAGVDTSSNQTITGIKTHAPTGLGGYFVPFELVNGNAPGVKGPSIQRNGGGGYTGVSWYTDTLYNWSIGQDFNLGGGEAFEKGEAGPNIADLVLANQVDANGTTSSDIFRIREGSLAAIANLAMPSNDVRFKIASYGSYATQEPETLKELLRFEIGDPASGITHLIKASTPAPAFGVTKAGWVSAGTTTAVAPFHALVPRGPRDALYLNLLSTADPGFITWSQGSTVIDWRLGRTQDNLADLALYQAAGSPSTAESPGRKVLHITRAGAVGVNTAPSDARLHVVDASGSANRYGVLAESAVGVSLGCGGGGRLQQALRPAGAPTSGTFAAGEQIRDERGELWLCVGGGTPGVWRRAATVFPGTAGGAVNLLENPVRLFDSRTNGGSRLPARAKVDVAIAGVVVNGVSIPVGAVAVIGNVTVAGTSAPSGYLTLYAEGTTPSSATSNINWSTADQDLNALALVKLNPSNGKVTIHNGMAGGSSPTHVIFDAVGFVT